ncbi:hypothetical protein L915_08776, partial [Phytophthora nicotianae]
GKLVEFLPSKTESGPTHKALDLSFPTVLYESDPTVWRKPRGTPPKS